MLATIVHSTPTQAQHNVAKAKLLSSIPLLLCICLTIAIRIWIAVRTNGIIDGDEGLVGIQAQRIVHGERPVYFYGQPYMGSLEAYLVAGLIALFGSSTWVMRAVPIMLSPLLVVFTWLISSELTTQSRLSPQARKIFIYTASFLVALPPIYDLFIEMRVWGGHIEAYIIMLALCYCTLRLLRSWHTSRLSTILFWWLAIGFLTGLGLWVYPVVILALATCALGIIIYCLWHWKLMSLKETAQRFLLGLPALFTLLIGALPALFWGAANNWQNIAYIFNISGTSKSLTAKFALIKKTSKYFVSCTGPRVIGGTLPAGKTGYLPFETNITALNTVLLLFGVTSIALCLLVIVVSFISPAKTLAALRNIIIMPMIFAALTLWAFCTSSATAGGLISPSCGVDFVGRYATPLALTLPFFGAVLVVLLIDGVTRYYQQRLAYLPHLLLILFIGSYTGTQLSVYQSTQTDYAFQSPYCYLAPTENGPILAYLEQHDVHNAWVTNLLGYPMMFKSDGQLAIADPISVIKKPKSMDWLNRIPDVAQKVLHSERPALIVLIKKDDKQNPVINRLNKLHITYKSATFPASDGARILVVIPDQTFPIQSLTLAEHSWFSC